MLATEIVETAKTSDIHYSVIWLHGLGADGHDFVPIVPQFTFPANIAVRFVFPHAPVRPVTINGGMSMRAWYDIYTPILGCAEKEGEILASVSQINDLIEAEIAQGIPASRIVLAGFSQGGVIAMHTALRFPQALAAVIALSTYLPFSSALLAQVPQRQMHLAFFSGHGLSDAIVPIAQAKQYVNALKRQGFNVDAHDYSMGHSVCPQEISDINKFFHSILII